MREVDEFFTAYNGAADRGPTGPSHDDPPGWTVGFYRWEDGKTRAEGPTLRAALLAWLDEYEDWLGKSNDQ